MDNKNFNFTDDFIIATMKLRNLHDALLKLEEVRIKCECNIKVCYELMHQAATGDHVHVRVFEYEIALAARQARLSISTRPRWNKIMDDIKFETHRVKNMKVKTYQALRPFAMREFE